jgi:hypothetical protein
LGFSFDEEGRRKKEEGRKSRVVAINQVLTVEIVIYGSRVSAVNILFFYNLVLPK